MRRPPARRPSPAMLVALVALAVALGGSGYAASSLVGPGGPEAQTANGDSSSERGARGIRGKVGPRGKAGPRGNVGPAGPQGAIGQTGPAAPTQYAEFFALMPPNNAATVAVGGAVDFPQDGPENGGIVRSGADTFVLPDIGTYRVAFFVSVSEAGQLQLSLNSTALPYTVYGRATGTTQIAGEALVATTTTNSVLSVVNPSGNSTALTITPLAGGTQPVAASLIIEQLS